MPRGTTVDGVDEGELSPTVQFTGRSTPTTPEGQPKRPKLFEFSGNGVTKSRFFSRSAAEADGSISGRTPETQAHPAGGNMPPPPWSSIGRRRREYPVPDVQEDAERVHDGDGDAIGEHRLRRSPAAEEDETQMDLAEGARDESNGCREERYSHQGNNSPGDESSSAWPRRTDGGLYAQPGRPNLKMHRWVSPRVGSAPAGEDAGRQRVPTAGDG